MNLQRERINTNSVQFKGVHGGFNYPKLFRSDSRVSGKIIIDGKKDRVVNLWSISPLGAIIDLKDKDGEGLKIGEELDLKLKMVDQNFNIQATIVTSVQQSDSSHLIGLRWNRFNECEDENKLQEINRRENRRWNCEPDYLPSGVIKNPYIFNDQIFFKMISVSKGGLKFRTSMKNTMIIPGIRFWADIDFPLVGRARIQFSAESTTIQELNSRSVLVVNAKFIDPDKKALAIIGQYVYQFSPEATLQDLKGEDLPVKSYSSGVTFDLCRGQEDYQEVLALRRKAYLQAKKIPENSTIEQMSDEFDSRSKILVARKSGKIVASARLVYNENEDQMEHEEFFYLPAGSPPKNDIVEVTRLCIDPDFQNGDLFYRLVKEIVINIIISGRSYILMDATKGMSRIYKKIGATVIGPTFIHSKLNDIPHYPLMGKVPNAVMGLKTNIVVWTLIYADLYDFLKTRSDFSSSKIARSKYQFYRFLLPMVKGIMSIEFVRKKILKFA